GADARSDRVAQPRAAPAVAGPPGDDERALGLGPRGGECVVDRRRLRALPWGGGNHPGVRDLGPAAAPISGRDGYAVRPFGAVRRRLLVGARVRRAVRPAPAP